ncbi:glycosyltransferase family 2 protein [Sulfobacillus harzensis]|uniref:Glycosyltransferase n=1 Tax=Sulfobacillus harzensis TaxID=2729629 RepID=A0A7Y0Q1D9_9FIRM|nr:glycosyltransferase [Sulfobacillus harzensis]NMP21347.1 glycosyltransferase [Sulfobacillus harzensis]
MLSVIIPCYNVEHYISECLASVLLWKDAEIIVVDDASTDGTVEQINRMLSHADANVQLIQLRQNAGPSHARNVGISRSSGDWLFFVDSDDVVLGGTENYAAQLAQGLRTHDVIYPEMIVRHGRTSIGKRYYQDILNVSPEKILRDNPIQHLLVSNYIGAFAFVSRDAIGDMRFNENLRAYEDWDLWLRMMLNGARFKFEPTPMGVYRVGREGSLSTVILRSSRNRVRSNLQILSLNYERVVGQPEAQQSIMRRMRQLAVELMLHPEN